VVSVERIGVKKTYQIEVANTHTYVMGNGVVSKNSELRWAAEIANDVAMKTIFQKDLDIHIETAKELVSGNWKQLPQADRDKARRDAKPVNFGLLYLMTACLVLPLFSLKLPEDYFSIYCFIKRRSLWNKYLLLSYYLCAFRSGVRK